MDTRSPAEPLRYLITGGGTAGHVYPGLALAEGIRRHEPDAEFLFVGARRGAEERIVPAQGHALQTLAVRGIPTTTGPFLWLQTIWRLGVSLLQAIRLILRFRPHAIIGTGGYASAPVLLAAVVLRSVRLWKGVLSLHEANIIPGRFNRWMSGWADFTGTSFPETLRFFSKKNSFWTGYPLRNDLEASSKRRGRDREEPKRRLGIPPAGEVLLVFGGSSGARTINRAVFEALPRLLQREGLTVFHATGHPQAAYDPGAEFRELLPGLPVDANVVQSRYRREEYLHHIEGYYEAADIVVCRSGAGAIWELAAYGTPSVLIPKSNLPGDHQVKNAYFLARRGQARILFEKRPVPPEPAGSESVDPDAFADAVLSMLDRKGGPEDRKKGTPAQSEIPSGKDLFYALIRRFRERGRAEPPIPQATAGPGWREEKPGSTAARTGIEWIGAEALLTRLEDDRKHKRELPEEERAYLKYKTDQLLASPRWQDRNAGVKLVGVIGYRERLPTLLYMVTDRTPAAWHRRLLGGDFEQVGFIRRNALQAVWRLRTCGPAVREALRIALRDPYYEVRSWAARAIERLSPEIGEDEEMVRLLRRNLKDRWFEVVVSSLRALAMITKDPNILSDLIPLLSHKNWKVQQATVRCLTRLMQADVIRLSKEAEEWVNKIPMKGLDFFPSFPLKQTWEDFQRVLSEKAACERPPETNKGAC
jgi:UDP-N-acetylglucosamine--N-acetylmuramyl-(pentapeptide) pyrophosphoryl-undecaprenol N-acetylglucosamine transferase